MSDKPKIYSTCKAGCQWETIHRSEFEEMASLIKVNLNEDGRYPVEIGKEYRAFFKEGINLAQYIGGGYFPLVSYNIRADLSDGNSTGVTSTLDYYPKDEYADSLVFRLLDVKQRSSNTTAVVICEIDGIRQEIEISLTVDGVVKIGTIRIEEAKKSFAISSDEIDKVFMLNSDATIKAEKGDSAYDVAVKNGFEGTEEEWIASLKGEKGDIGIDYLISDIPNTTQNITFDDMGNVASITHTNANGEAVRTDTFTYTDTTVTEVRTLSSGESRTIIFHYDTLKVEVK